MDNDLLNQTCPYCNSKVIIEDSIKIYKNKSYGYVYMCANYPKCNAYVGCHGNTQVPMGTVANMELRNLRHEAHKYFDQLWQRKNKKGFVNARFLGYQWLSKKLKLPMKKTHIGMFDQYQTKKVIELCKPYYKGE